MSKRRLDRLEDSLSPKEAVLLWMAEAHAFGSLPAYTASLIDEPVTAQPFVAVPVRVEKAIWGAMRRDRRDVIVAAIREAVADTVSLLKLVTGLNAHIEEVLRLERLRRAALYMWSRSFDPERRAKTAPPPEWTAAVATLVGAVRGTEEARRTAEARYLDGHDCLFPELAAEWQDLRQAIDVMAGPGLEESAHEAATQRVRQLIRMARADGLDAVGLAADADVLARRATRIWREGDIGWVADIIEAAWARWLDHYPVEWRTLAQAIPYVHLRTSWRCERPRTLLEHMSERIEVDSEIYDYIDAREDWERRGSIGPPPEFSAPELVGHTHPHDHGVCIDPWLVDHASEERSITNVLRHELAHAIAGTFGHGDEWVEMCAVIGHELTQSERQECEREREARAVGDEPPVGR